MAMVGPQPVPPHSTTPYTAGIQCLGFCWLSCTGFNMQAAMLSDAAIEVRSRRTCFPDAQVPSTSSTFSQWRACPSGLPCLPQRLQPTKKTNQGAQDDQRAQEHQAAALGDTRRLQPGQGLNRRWTRGAARTSPEIGRKEAQASCMYVLSVCPTDSVERVHCSVFSVVCSTLCVFSFYSSTHSRHVSPRRMCSFHKLYLNCTPPQLQTAQFPF